MKLVRFRIQEHGRSRLGFLTPLGIIDADSCWRLYCLNHELDAPPLPISPRRLLAEGSERMAQARAASEWILASGSTPTVLFNVGKVRLQAPVGRPPKILCIARNYRDHCVEQGVGAPSSPVVFAKYATAIAAPGDPIVRPRITVKLDYEAELGVVIGRPGRHIPEDRALEHVGGYMNFNDVSARDLQAADGQWLRGKSCDTFAPIGPALVTPDEAPDPQNLRIQCRVNGETVQDANTSQMIFSVAHLISFISEFLTLEVGDVIATGTPHGVGHVRKPPRFLNPGDRVEVEIEKLGVLANTVVDEV
jgi:2-keto-4-pentenoate hydratase/2-oxohepta-3-ene-1,7-dioic acid hydratase in catechol pathway